MNSAQAAYNEAHRHSTARQLAWATIILGPVSLPLAILLIPGVAAVACGLVVRSLASPETEKRFLVMALIGSTFGLLGIALAIMFWFVLG
jgi:hypothetical protein